MFRKRILAIGLSLSIFFSVAYFLYVNLNMTFFEFFELKTYDMRYKFREAVKDKTPRDYDVVIVGVDEKSLIKIGKWPWSRDVHGKLITKLKEYGIKSVGFDVSFSEAGASSNLSEYKKELKGIVAQGYKGGDISETKAVDLLKKINTLKTDEDFQFAKALKETGNTVIGTYNVISEEEEIDESVFDNNHYKKNRYVAVEGIMDEVIEVGRTGERRVNPFEIYKIIPPIDILGKFAFGIAPYEVGVPDPDGVLRGVVVVTKETLTNLYFPPLYLVTYLKALNLTMEENVSFNMRESQVEIYNGAMNDENLFKVIPTNKDGYQRLFFYGKGHTFKYISYYDIINGLADPNDFKDKIALVGYTDSAKGLFDLRATPLDPTTPGVELHATAIQNLIDDKFMIRAEVLPTMGVIFLFGIIITLSAGYKQINTLISSLISVIVIVIYFVLSYKLFENGIWIETFYPAFAFIILYSTLEGFNYFFEEGEKRYIKDVFGHYISPDLVQDLIKTPDMLKLGGEKKELTAFFSDIQGFTSISESMDPETLVEFLNEYLSLMTEIILKHSGTIDKYIGDAIMAIFGAPVDLENNALSCCYAALEYQERLEALREKNSKEGKQVFYARIGINTGDMVVGNMGCEVGDIKKFNYTIIGDEVNLASRLEGANKMYGTFIMISENTYEKVKDYFEVRILDRAKVKGKKKAVQTYELMGKKAELPDTIMKVKELYDYGMECYFAQKWDEADEAFKSALEISPEDGPSKLYMKRVEQYKETPPPENWDGSYTFTSK